MNAKGDTWAIVLAAGDGTRLQSLVRLVHDQPLPKQFATLVGSRSLLQTTIDRVSTFASPERTIVVVGRDYEDLAREQLADWDYIQTVSQPQNRGTALGILLPLARIRRCAPDASVVIFPSDHHIPRPAPFIDGIRASLRASGVTLLGVTPDRADSELGWIEPHRPLGGGLESVRRFVEKPDPTTANELFLRGGLWNSFVIAGRLQELWALIAAHLPLDAAAFEGATEPAAIDALYQRVGSEDFSRAVLQKACDLQVARVEGSGWADWGTPERVIQSLNGTPWLDLLLRRIIDGQRRNGDTTLSFALHSASANDSEKACTGRRIDDSIRHPR